MEGELLTNAEPTAAVTREEGDGASQCDASERLAVPYGFPPSRVVRCDNELEANSISASKSTDEMTEREMANASDHGEASAVPAPKSCYNYFDLESSCNSLSDYPTDEQTSNTLNTLDSFHRNMFGVDEAPWKGSSSARVKVVQQPFGLQSSIEQLDVERAVVHDNARGNNSNRGSFNAHVKKNTLMDRLHILQMAKKRMAGASQRKAPSDNPPTAGLHDAQETTMDNTKNHVNVSNANKSAEKTSDASTNVVQEKRFDASPAGIAARKESSLKDTDQTSTAVPSGCEVRTEDSKDAHRDDPIKVRGNASFGQNRLGQYEPDRDSGSIRGADEDSFLDDAIIEYAAPLPNPNTTDRAVASDNAADSDNLNHTIQQLDTFHSTYPPDCTDESLSHYDVHASTLSQSTMTSSNQQGGVRNVFANVGGDVSIYNACNRTLIHPANSSFETSASPLTVVASGARPRMPDSRETSVDSTFVDEMILNESYLAVRNLGAGNLAQVQQEGFQHTPVGQAAAITPVRKNANSNQSIESYSYSQAFQNSDNITSNPEIRSLSTTAPETTSIHEEYSFCPSSKHSSAFSTLTDEYLHYYDVPRRTGITAVAEEKECEVAAAAVGSDDKSPELRKKSSGLVDVDTNDVVAMGDEESFRYESSSLARPPQPLPHHDSGTWMYGYGNSEHLSSIIQYPSAEVGSRRGDGEGYVDEEAAMRYASLHRSGRRLLSSSSCLIRILVLSAMVLLMVSVASVTFGVIIQKDSKNSNSGALLGRPYSAQGGDGSALSGSGNEISGSDATGFVPAVPGSFTLPTSSPTLEATSFTSSSKLPVSPAPSPDFTLENHMQAIDELLNFPSSEPTFVMATSAPSNKPTPHPTIHPSSSPMYTMSRTPFPSPTITLQTTSLISQTPNQTDSRIQTRTIKIQASRDTYIKENSIDWNYGSSDFLRVDGEPRSIAVIAFDIDPTNDLLQSSKRHYDPTKETQSETNRSTQTARMIQITEAKLRLYSVEESWTGGTVYALSDARQWKETELTWDNAREEVNASGEVLIGPISEAIDEGVWYEVSVTNAFDCCVEAVGTMYLNLLIRSNATDGVTYASKEYESGMFAPELVLTFSTEMSSTSPSSNLELNQYTPTSQPTTGTETAAPILTPESAFPTYFPTISTVTQNRATFLSLPALPNFVPRGCPNHADSHFSGSLGPLGENSSVRVVFPARDSYVRGGDCKGCTFGSSDYLEVAGSSEEFYQRKIVIGFDSGLLSFNSSIQIRSVYLRMFVNSIDFYVGGAVSIFKLPSSITWNEGNLTWDTFGTPQIEKEGHHFLVTPEDKQKWIDIDITDFIERTETPSNLTFVLQTFSPAVENFRILFASKETCHSPKLVFVTTPS